MESTPTRRIAADKAAGYGMIATPDAKKYESATAELGDISEGKAYPKSVSAEMTNVLAEDQ